jgi:hypothetical protein
VGETASVTYLTTMAELVRDIIHGYRDIMDNKSGEFALAECYVV